MRDARSTGSSDRRQALKRRLARAGVMVAAACTTAALAACGSSGTSDTSSATSSSSATTSAGTTGSGSGELTLPPEVSSIAAMVPAEIAKRGTLVFVGSHYPPALIQPAGGGSPTGWEVWNARGVSAVMGLKPEFRVIPFDGVIPGLQANRYDIANSFLTVTPDRTKVVTFVTDHVARDGLMVSTDSKISSAGSMTDLCGLTLAAVLGSTEAQLVEQASHACEAAGKPPVELKTFKELADVNLAVKGSRVDAAMAEESQIAHVLDQTGDEFRFVKLPWAPGLLSGMGLARNATTTPQLAKAIQAATDYLIKDGYHQRVLDKFNRGLGTIKKSEIIPPPTGS